MLITPGTEGAFRPDPVHRQQCLAEAARCRRLAHATLDREASMILLARASSYEQSAWASPAG